MGSNRMPDDDFMKFFNQVGQQRPNPMYFHQQREDEMRMNYNQQMQYHNGNRAQNFVSIPQQQIHAMNTQQNDANGGLQIMQASHPQVYYDMGQMQYQQSAMPPPNPVEAGAYTTAANQMMQSSARPAGFFSGPDSFSLANSSNHHSVMLQQAQVESLYSGLSQMQPMHQVWRGQQQVPGIGIAPIAPQSVTTGVFVPLAPRGGHYLGDDTESDEEMMAHNTAQRKKRSRAPPKKPATGYKPSIQKPAAKPKGRRKSTTRLLVLRLKVNGDYLRESTTPLFKNSSDGSQSSSSDDNTFSSDDGSISENEIRNRSRSFVGQKTPRIFGDEPSKPLPFMPPLAAIIKPIKKVPAAKKNTTTKKAGTQSALRHTNRVSLAKLSHGERGDKCLQALAQYIEDCGGTADMVSGWQACVETRKEGSTAGSFDVYYYDPSGRRFRSRTEVARFMQLELPLRQSGASAKPKSTGSKKQAPANLGFGRTKKARRRAAHARRFAQLTARMRLGLAELFEQTEKRDRAKHDSRYHRQLIDEAINAASRASSPDPMRILTTAMIQSNNEEEDRSSRGGDANQISRLERLRQKLYDARSKHETAQARVLAAEHFASQATAAAVLADAEASLENGDDDGEDQNGQAPEEEDGANNDFGLSFKLDEDGERMPADHSGSDDDDDGDDDNDENDDVRAMMRSSGRGFSSAQSDDRMPKKEKMNSSSPTSLDQSRQISRRARLAYAAKQRRQEEDHCFKEVDRERKNRDKARRQMARLEGLVAEAEEAAEKRVVAEAERRRKKAAKEAEILAKRAEREAALEAKRERKVRDAATRKRERDGELEQRRIEKDAEAAATAASKAMAELERMAKQRYPMEDMELVNEPAIELAKAPYATDPAEIFIGLSPDLTGQILYAHALLRGVYGALGEHFAPSLEAFAAVMVLPLSAMNSGPMSTIQELHSALLRVLLTDTSVEAWWPLNGSNEELIPIDNQATANEAIVTKKRKTKRSAIKPRPEHPWMKTVKKYEQLALNGIAAYRERQAEEDVDDSENEDRIPIQQDAATLDGISNELKRGIEDEARTRRWVALLEEASAPDTDLRLVQEALQACSKVALAPAAKAWFKARASRSPTTEMRSTMAELARRARNIRARAWCCDHATEEEMQQQNAMRAAQVWRNKADVWRGYDVYEVKQEVPPPAQAPIEIKTDKADRMQIEAKPIAPLDADDEGWWTTGSEYVGRKVRRSVLDEMGRIMSHSDGIVAGWLPAEHSDYIDENNEPKALYHVRLDSGELAGDREDLELPELLDSLVPLERIPSEESSGRAVDPAPAEKVKSSQDLASPPPVKVRVKLPPELRRGGSKSTDKATAPSKAKAGVGTKKRKASPTNTPIEEIATEPEEINLGFPRQQLATALTTESMARRALAPSTRSVKYPDKPEASLVYMMPRPPSEAVGDETWISLVVAVAARLLEFEREVSEKDSLSRNSKLAQITEWLGEGLPYGALTPNERILIVMALCDAFSTTNYCAQAVDMAQEVRKDLEIEWEREDKELRKQATMEDRRVANEIKHRIATKALERRQRRHRSNSEFEDDDQDGDAPIAKKRRRAPTPSPLSAALDQLLNSEAPIRMEQRNPKQSGSRAYALYERYKEATTLNRIIELGGRRGDIFNDLKRGYCKLMRPEHESMFLEAKAAQPPRGPGKPPSSQRKQASKPASAHSGDDESPKADKPLTLPQLSRHRLNLEIAQVRAIEVCGGGKLKFTDDLEVFESHDSEDQAALFRSRRKRGIRALVLATEAANIEALKIAIEYAHRPDVMLEITVSSDKHDEHQHSDDDMISKDGSSDNSSGDEKKIETAPSKRSSESKRVVMRQLVDAKLALREVEIKTNDHDRVRARAAKRRYTLYPRIDPLGADRHYHSYWLFPSDNDTEKALDTTHLTVWRRLRSDTEESPDTRLGSHTKQEEVRSESHPPSWAAFVGVETIRQLADSLDDRGVRERELKTALHDILPLKTKFVDLSFLEAEEEDEDEDY